MRILTARATSARNRRMQSALAPLFVACLAISGLGSRTQPVTAKPNVTAGALPSAITTEASGRAARQIHSRHAHRVGRQSLLSGPPGSADPAPIPGGDFIPGFGTIHNFLSGPSDITFEGVPLDGSDVEPGGITNFRGFTAQAYLESDGGALGNDGVLYDFASDIRVMQGEYVSLDGTHHRGTFVVI